GMKVDPSRAAAVREHAGKKYFFCCNGCAQKFAATPEQYLGKKSPTPGGLVQLGVAPAKPAAPSSHAAMPAPATASTKYFCPMDPEVVSDRPGSCPKCGMALEPELASLGCKSKTEYFCPMHPE